MIFIGSPWTGAALEQVVGRVRRQGAVHKKVQIIFPQVIVYNEKGHRWSWDLKRMNAINDKQTIADCANDGIPLHSEIKTQADQVKEAILMLHTMVEEEEPKAA
jgi:hypothetical protein